ncbi:MAG: inosine/xanthosine triphosphatase [bacterium]|nr:inosine/xanthosine triphosphatase [bacterium]
MIIFVGSQNPVKIAAVSQAAAALKPQAVTGFAVPSNVSEQPMTDPETRQGAYNRAMAAMVEGKKTLVPESKTTLLAIGLEGGVTKNEDGELWSTVWASVVDEEGKRFEANGGRVRIPEPIAAAILSGGEMGPIMEKMMGIDNLKHKQGMFGIITNNFVDRTSEYSTIAKIALGLWYGQGWDESL